MNREAGEATLVHGVSRFRPHNPHCETTPPIPTIVQNPGNIPNAFMSALI